jgi:hypothetical protein
LAILYIFARKRRLVVVVAVIDSRFTTRFAVDDEAIRDIHCACRKVAIAIITSMRTR